MFTQLHYDRTERAYTEMPVITGERTVTSKVTNIEEKMF
jgi:hypothetical protein